MSNQSKKKPILQLLISSKGKKNFNFLDEMFHKCVSNQFSILLVDQTKRQKNFKPFHKKYSFIYYNIPSNGLVRSPTRLARNLPGAKFLNNAVNGGIFYKGIFSYGDFDKRSSRLLRGRCNVRGAMFP